jgi:hypothetical protein
MKKFSFKIGEPYHIVFIDHCMGDWEVNDIKIEAMGWIYGANKKLIKLIYWMAKDEDGVIESEECEMVTILRSAIVKATHLTLK